MINLLPTYEKKNINKEYKLRLVSVALFFIAGLIAISVVLLLPSFILASFEYSSVTKQLEVEKKSLTDTVGVVDPIEIARDVNSKLGVLKKEGYSTPQSSGVFIAITKKKPKYIKITAMFYDRGSEKGKITVSGVSRNRETLLSFLQALEDENMFTKVDLPISSFVEGIDIDFSISINIEKKAKSVVKESEIHNDEEDEE